MVTIAERVAFHCRSQCDLLDRGGLLFRRQLDLSCCIRGRSDQARDLVERCCHRSDLRAAHVAVVFTAARTSSAMARVSYVDAATRSASLRISSAPNPNRSPEFADEWQPVTTQSDNAMILFTRATTGQ
jgi:hypothetical protein